MASLVEELIGILEEEQKIYKDLVRIGNEKMQIVVRGDIPALEKLTEFEQERSDELLSLSNKQMQILNDIKTVLGKAKETLTVTTLIGFLSSQPEVQEKLTTARNRLVESANQMQLVNQQNEILLQQAIELTEFDITLFKSMRQAPETANYDRNANSTGTLLGTSGFDTKQ